MSNNSSVDPVHFTFKHPFTALIAGPTSSGKTMLVRRLLQFKNHLIPNLLPDSKIVWAYGQWQKTYEKPIENMIVEYHEGLPDNNFIETIKPDLIIIDDLMNELGNNIQLANLFSKGSHHLGMSILFIVQNVFHQAKYMRNISLNCHYMILMKNPRDKSQIYTLAKQLYPNRMKFLLEAYEDATREPYSYLKIDLTPSTPERFRLQSEIFPLNSDNKYNIVTYQMK